MRRMEHYYSYEQYDNVGLRPFVTHIREYLAGERTVPVTKTPWLPETTLYFTFSDELYHMFISDSERVKKPYECAMKYGLRGYSAGGKNGVFWMRKGDARLMQAADAFGDECRSKIIEDLVLAPSEVSRLRKVKVVYHEPSGEPRGRLDKPSRWPGRLSWFRPLLRAGMVAVGLTPLRLKHKGQLRRKARTSSNDALQWIRHPSQIPKPTPLSECELPVKQVRVRLGVSRFVDCAWIERGRLPASEKFGSPREIRVDESTEAILGAELNAHTIAHPNACPRQRLC